MNESVQTFEDLAAFRRELLVVRAQQRHALAAFYDEESGGYRSVQSRPLGHLSPSSTATCVMSLTRAGQWDATPAAGTGPALAKRLLLDPPTTNGLDEGNLYTEAFVWEAANALIRDRDAGVLTVRAGYDDLAADPNTYTREQELAQKLTNGLARGWATVAKYPPSGYMTQLALRVLQVTGNAPEAELAGRIAEWAWAETHRQIALDAAKLKSFDPFQLAYCTLINAQLGAIARATPDERQLLDTALDCFFAAQLPDGTWPRSAPIFDLPGVGSAYCYEYELLTQLLVTAPLHDQLLRHLPPLRRAYGALIVAAYRLPDQSLAWSSGHRPNVEGPESWATASAYDFAHALERLISEEIRQSVFRYVRAPYVQPRSAISLSARTFAPRLLDSRTRIGDQEVSARDTLFESFVRPISESSPRLENGLALPVRVPTTAILFGPPGTSKTQISQAIADYLGWPRLSLDPSHFVRRGIDMVSAEANTLFSMLEALDRVVVLLDEIDELVRERSGSDEFLSRFLTTTMLPKLAAISNAKRIVFVVATNHIEQFDIAISRPGRFDLILQIMPPSIPAKFAHWSNLSAKLDSPQVTEDDVRRQHLAALTFDEASRLADRVSTLTRSQALGELDRAWVGCTLNAAAERSSEPRKTWYTLCQEQHEKNRVPAGWTPSADQRSPQPRTRRSLPQQRRKASQ